MKSLWTILVPVSDNSGNQFSASYHQLWDAKVREISGGLTICSTGKGTWTSNDGNIFTEKMIPVMVLCSREDIEKIADLTASHYSQKAVMFYKITDDVEIKHYNF